MKLNTQIILGFAAAAVAGAAIGMLLAPEKGKDLQNKLKDSAQDWLDQFSSLLNTGRDVADQIRSKAHQEARSFQSELAERK